MSHQTERFVLKEEHIKLLRAMYWEFQEDENGAPGVDCKRPYGNSWILPDVAEALGRKLPDEEAEEYDEVCDELYGLHAQTGKALEVILVSGSFKPGAYERTLNYRQGHSPWTKVDG